MRLKTIFSILLGVVTFALIAHNIYKVTIGKAIGFNEIFFISFLLILFLFTITWGSKKQRDGILYDEELGKRINEKSSNASYFLLLFFIFIAVIADRLVNVTVNVFLLILLGLALITQPFMTFLTAQNYQLRANLFGKVAEKVEKLGNKITHRRYRPIIFIFGVLTSIFVLSPLFGDPFTDLFGYSFYDLLVFLFGEPSQ